MNLPRRVLGFFAVCVLSLSLAAGQVPPEKKTQAPAKAPQPMYQLAQAMAERLGTSLQVKTVVGEPMKVGKVTLLPIMMIDIGFGGGGGGAPQNMEMGGKGFYMSGEARPLGFVVVTKAGTQFISVGKVPGK
jgi:uncharacterized spore protein YtfJ